MPSPTPRPNHPAIAPRHLVRPCAAIALSLALGSTMSCGGDSDSATPATITAPTVDGSERRDVTKEAAVEATRPPTTGATDPSDLSAPPATAAPGPTSALPGPTPPAPTQPGPTQPAPTEPGPTLPGPTDYPALPTSAQAVLDLLVPAERAIADPSTPAPAFARAAWEQQAAYRALGMHPDWDDEVNAGLPAELRTAAADHARARRAFVSMRTTLSDTLPAWEIIAPAPLDDLRSFYDEAERDSGIEWEYLAAINLVESAMGRINGVSTANAQGPMQFLPSTWEAVADGDITDIRDPHDAIIGAGRYLVRRGGPADMDRAIFGYNNHSGYVDGVSAYAKILRDDPDALRALYEWQVMFASTEGDIHIPVGYLETAPLPVTTYLEQ